jgi:uncharacterized protein
MRRTNRPRSGVRLAAVLGILLIGGFAAAAAQSVQIPASPARWATDEAGFISPQTRADLDARLESFERETGHQVLLYIGRTTGDVPLEDFTAKSFAAWKVGRKGLDDGLVFFIFAEDRKIRIEVGYGLEGIVPDAVAGRVINNILVPGIQRGDADGAVRASIASLLETVSGRPGPAEDPPTPRKSSKGEVPPIFLIIGGIIFLIIFITNPRLAMWLLFSMLSGGRGGGGGGGGGFGGGGGRSGRGGASGGW